MASLQPLSLRCIFYKGAAAGAGFHSSLSVCLGLRRCWISVSGNVVVLPVLLGGLKGFALFAESFCLFFFLVCDFLCCEYEGKEKGTKLLLLGILGKVLRRHGGTSPGLTGEFGSGWESFFGSIVSCRCGLRGPRS